MSVHFMIFMSKFKEAEVKEQLIIVSLMDVGFLRIACSLASKSYTTDCPTGTSASRRIQKKYSAMQCSGFSRFLSRLPFLQVLFMSARPNRPTRPIGLLALTYGA